MMKLRWLVLPLCLFMLLTVSCSGKKAKNDGYVNPETQGAVADLGDDYKSFGDSFEDLDLYEGCFEGESSDVVVTCVSGTQDAYKMEGTTLIFTAIGEDTVYSISGKLRGNILIDVGKDCKFELEMCGFSLVCDSTNPITVTSGDEVTIKAKKDHENYIYDLRDAIESDGETLFSGAIHSDVDLELAGKGKLTVVSENNNGIHSKDDLQVKNLTLLVVCLDNALKGNDGVEITDAETILIATAGDGIKTSSNAVSEKGNQKGNVSVSGGIHAIYAACDGIDAAYNVVIDGASTVLNIYTDKYSNYSTEVTANEASEYFIRFTSNAYSYSVKYYNSDSDFLWVNATYHSSVKGERSTYYYYSFPKHSDYDKMQFFIYSSDMKQGQDAEYLVASEYLEPNTACDTFALTSRGNQLSYSWTNYTTKVQEGGFGGPGGMGGPGGPGGPGGMNDGNPDKGDHSTKGIKAANEIVINEGTVNVKAYDDALHANNDVALENGATPLGNVTVNGGTISLYSNDDGLHADGTVNIISGTVNIIHSYEGIEGSTVNVSGGYVSVISTDDGINATTTAGTAVSIGGGTVYIYCSGDGIDSNSRTSYSGIVFSGGNTVVISNSNGNSALDTEQGYCYTGGAVVAIMPRGGMSSEATHCQNFSGVGKSLQMSLSKDQFLIVEIGNGTAIVRMPVAMSATVVVLGDSSPGVDVKTSVSEVLDANGVCWN